MKTTRHIFFLFLLPCLSFAKAGTVWDSSSLSIYPYQVIEVTAPVGARRIKLETKNPDNGRWEILNTGHLPSSKTGKLYFKIPKELRRNQIRFLSSDQEIIPFSMLEGRSSFSPRTGNSNRYDNMLLRTMDGGVAESDTSTDNESSNVQESDLWRIIGDRLYYFNQMRGLQVIDLSFPDNPEVTARYRLPASGEQMYVTDNGRYAFLIVRKGHQLWPYQSEVRILKINESQITEVDRLELGGHYKESRLIGDKLYLVSEKWEKNKIEHDGWQFSYSTYLQTFELNNPESAVAIDEQVIPGSPQVISATNEALILVTRDPRNYYQKHIVRVFDLTQRNGVPEISASLRPGGRILDKFKLRLRDGILTTISQAYRNDNWSRRFSLLENFDLRSQELMGSLELAERETLYATNFDGNYAYIVTFLQTDPLFVIDLSNPYHPKVVSELIVPGWSEYIQPLGDQLFAVGVEDSMVTASIFDLSDKSNPSLSDRIYLGDEDGYSWSEANYDEKAIGRFPSKNTFLIPYQSWERNGYKNKIQILEIQNTKLVARGSIEHRFQARRSSPDSYGTKIFSVSGNELLVTNFINPDKPVLLKTFPLAWKVDKVHPLSNFLIQLEDQDSGYWGWSRDKDEANATLRVTSKTNPDHLISTYNLGEGRLVGSHGQDEWIHLALIHNDLLKIMIVSLDSDGEVSKIGETEVQTKLNEFNCRMECLILDENFFCWATSKNENVPYLYYADDVRRSSIADISYQYSSTNSPEIHVFSYETKFDQVKITHESNASLVFDRNTEWSDPILLGEMLLYGSKNTTYRYHPEDHWRLVHTEFNSSLHRIVLKDLEKPMVSNSLPAPGLLIGAQQFLPKSIESILFMESKDSTVGFFRPSFRSEEAAVFGRSLSACAFDGSNLFFLDEMEIDESGLAVALIDDQLLVPQGRSQGYGLQTFTINELGLFQQQSRWFGGNHLLDYSVDQSIVLARTDKGMLFADSLLYDPSINWEVSELSGSFSPEINRFVKTDNQILIPSGNYGVEVLSFPELSEPQERRGMTQRRNTTDFENWVNIETSKLRIFDSNDTPVIFSSTNSSGWKFRPDSVFDTDVNGLEGHWKKNSWFGTFYDRCAPWMFHTRLGWVYAHEETNGEFWLWRAQTGWTWSSREVFPYLFSHSDQSWIYLELEKSPNKMRTYHFQSQQWTEE